MNERIRADISTATQAVLSPLDSPEEREAKLLFNELGPAPQEPVVAFRPGAKWTAFATREELLEAAKVEGWIQRREEGTRLLRRRQQGLMQRCIRRMRRSQGKDLG